MRFVAMITLLASVTVTAQLVAQPRGESAEPQVAEPKEDQAEPKNGPQPRKVELPGFKRLLEDQPLWIHPGRKLVVVDGEVSMNRGPLEMFACPKGTKEHESVVAVHCPPRFIHAALLAIGAKSGSPVQFDPKYKPASGQVIEVYVLWKDKDGKKRSARAQEWVRDVKTGKQLKTPFVFAGSGFWTDEGNGMRYYHADGGDFICVSNFPSATLDLPVESSQSNEALVYEAFEKRIPKRGTKVRLVLAPKPALNAGEKREEGAEQSDKIGKASTQTTADSPAPATP